MHHGTVGGQDVDYLLHGLCLAGAAIENELSNHPCQNNAQPEFVSESMYEAKKRQPFTEHAISCSESDPKSASPRSPQTAHYIGLCGRPLSNRQCMKQKRPTSSQSTLFLALRATQKVQIQDRLKLHAIA
jgi:hypothetical protein